MPKIYVIKQYLINISKPIEPFFWFFIKLFSLTYFLKVFLLQGGGHRGERVSCIAGLTSGGLVGSARYFLDNSGLYTLLASSRICALFPPSKLSYQLLSETVRPAAAAGFISSLLLYPSLLVFLPHLPFYFITPPPHFSLRPSFWTEAVLTAKLKGRHFYKNVKNQS